MSKASDLIEQIMKDMRKRDGGVFSTSAYSDEPILKTGRQMMTGIPDRIKEMRAIAAKYGDSIAYDYDSWLPRRRDTEKIFFEQALLMADYEDDHPYEGLFAKYYPTYEDMNDRVLRGYFTWRTFYRKGIIPVTQLSFLYVYAYELICGIGVEPGEPGYRALEKLRDDYQGADWSFPSNMDSWMIDYAIYHGLPASLYSEHRWCSPAYGAVATLARAERSMLRSIDGSTALGQSGEEPSPSDLFVALNSVSRYHFDRSKLLKTNLDDAIAITHAVFRRMVEHCKRRRKREFVEGLFGPPGKLPYRMFSSAVFYSPETHPDVKIDLGNDVFMICSEGRWSMQVPCRIPKANRFLGDMLHVIDETMRARLGIDPLKRRDVQGYLRKIVEEEVAAHFEAVEAAKRPAIVIDRSQLDHIRRAAAETREALLVDEEREMTGADASSVLPHAETPSMPAAAVEAAPAAPVAPEASASLGLTPLQHAILTSLLEGTIEDLELPATTMMSLEVDAINEVFLDIVGDTVIEMPDDVPLLVEDYRDDVKEVLL